ncbi:MAG: hypothetical protein ACOX25_02000 [Caldicoprobacterales bacterium]|jgi:alpha-tubulin suppressor-like RCC1 family protein|nr:hypothetical protein [Clostridiales bacterium]
MKKGLLILILCAIVLTAASVIAVTVLVPLIRYNQADVVLNEGRYEEAIVAFADLGDYKDSAEKLLESRYRAAEAKLNEGKYEQAMQELSELESYRDSPDLYREARFRWGKVLMAEGAYRDSLELLLLDIEYSGVRDEIKKIYEKAVQSGEITVAYDAATSLRDFEAITGLNLQVLAAGRNHVVALRRDGTVVAAGNNEKGQCNVQDWKDIIAVVAGFEYTVGLRSDGTVVATGFNNNGQCDVQDWADIVTVYAGNTSTDTIGVKADGTIVAVGVGGLEGKNYHQQIPGKADSMVKMCPGWRGILVLMEDGDVKFIPSPSDMEGVNRWMCIKDVSIGTGHAVGLMIDGTVVTAGRNTSGQNDVDGWANIIALAASNSNTAGMKKDGTVMVAGSDKKGQKDAEKWKDIVAVSVGPGYVVGLRVDGTVVAAGQITRVEENEKVLEEIASWQNIGPAS